MAQGQTTRNNLSLRNTEDVQGAFREVKRWADRLPLGAAGFLAWDNANQGVGAGAAPTCRLNTLLQNRERWRLTDNSFKVPPGLSGVYVLNTMLYWAVGAVAISVSIAVNGVAVVQVVDPTAQLSNNCAATVLLQEDDVITVQISNDSAGTITITSFSGGSFTPKVPFLSAWRISLL